MGKSFNEKCAACWKTFSDELETRRACFHLNRIKSSILNQCTTSTTFNQFITFLSNYEIDLNSNIVKILLEECVSEGNAIDSTLFFQVIDNITYQVRENDKQFWMSRFGEKDIVKVGEFKREMGKSKKGILSLLWMFSCMEA